MKEIQPIAYIHNDFKEKFGIPRQSGRAENVHSRIVFEKEYRVEEALRGINGFSHLWLIFGFSEAETSEFSPTVRPPRLGGNTRVGVFASRSPYRPNGLGLSCVRLVEVEQGELIVAGADLLDGTPIYDVKPYLPHADCKPQATGGYASAHENHRLNVLFKEGLQEKLPAEKLAGLTECLADDPRPSYQSDPAREYGMRFGDFNLKFTVDGDTLTVHEITPV